MNKPPLLFVTDLGMVKAGPKTTTYIKDIERGLMAGRRTKTRAAAVQKMVALQAAVEVFAEIEWASGGVLEKLP